MRRAVPVFAVVFVCFNTAFAALFVYVLARGMATMDAVDMEDPLLYSFCKAVVYALMSPGILLWEAIPENIRTNALEWTLILLVHTIYCIIITAIILRLLRWMRNRTETAAAPVE